MSERAHRTDVAQIVSYADEKNYKAIISLILSSGMNSKFIRNMTLEDLLNSCNHYFEGEKPTIDELLDKNPIEDNFIACFDIGTEKAPRMTCCSPEALSLTLDYIEKFRIPFESPSDNVFLNLNNNPVTTNYISNFLGDLNNIIDGGHRSHDFRPVTAGKLRGSFQFVCETYLPEFEFKKDVINLMNGNRSVRNHHFYEAVCEDRFILIGPYLEIVDLLYLMPDRYTVEKYSALNSDFDDIY